MRVCENIPIVLVGNKAGWRRFGRRPKRSGRNGLGTPKESSVLLLFFLTRRSEKIRAGRTRKEGRGEDLWGFAELHHRATFLHQTARWT